MLIVVFAASSSATIAAVAPPLGEKYGVIGSLGLAAVIPMTAAAMIAYVVLRWVMLAPLVLVSCR